MQQGHDAEVKEFQRQAKSAKDPDLKAWAGKTLPTLQEHQAQIRQMSASIGKSSGGSASPSSATTPLPSTGTTSSKPVAPATK